MNRKLIRQLVPKEVLKKFKEERSKVVDMLKAHNISEDQFKDVMIATHKETGDRSVVFNETVIGTL
jgi:hypothetical protein